MSHEGSSNSTNTNNNSEHNSPKIVRKRPQSVSLARVLVYDGAEASGPSSARPHLTHHPHSSAVDDELRKLNLGPNPIFGSVSHRRISHHHSLTIPSRGAIDPAADFNTNLIRVRSCALGKSAPSLSAAMVRSIRIFIGPEIRYREGLPPLTGWWQIFVFRPSYQ